MTSALVTCLPGGGLPRPTFARLRRADKRETKIDERYIKKRKAPDVFNYTAEAVYLLTQCFSLNRFQPFYGFPSICTVKVRSDYISFQIFDPVDMHELCTRLSTFVSCQHIHRIPAQGAIPCLNSAYSHTASEFPTKRPYTI